MELFLQVDYKCHHIKRATTLHSLRVAFWNIFKMPYISIISIFPWLLILGTTYIYKLSWFSVQTQSSVYTKIAETLSEDSVKCALSLKKFI